MTVDTQEPSEPSFREQLLKEGRELHLSMVDGEHPYLVPLNYGYTDGRIYIHSGLKGKKLECLRRNPRVCFAINQVKSRVDGERACQWSTSFRSLIGYGVARILESREEKIMGYDIIMTHFGGPTGKYDEKYLQASLIICIEIESLTEKQSEGG